MSDFISGHPFGANLSAEGVAQGYYGGQFMDNSKEYVGNWQRLLILTSCTFVSPTTSDIKDLPATFTVTVGTVPAPLHGHFTRIKLSGGTLIAYNGPSVPT